MISILHKPVIHILPKWGAFVSMLILCFSSLSGQVANYDKISIEKFKALVDSSKYYQKRADQVEESTIYLRKELAGKKDPTAKASLENEILSMEELYMSYLQLAREYYQKAKATGIPFSEAVEPVKEEEIVDHKKNIIAIPVLTEEIELEEDKLDESEVDSLQIVEELEEKNALSSTSSHIYEFQILSSEQDKLSLALNEPLPSGVIYRIQIGIFKQLESGKFFKGIEPVMAESIEGKDVIRYSVGLFSQYRDAEVALVKVKEKGFTDAFVVAYYNQVRVQLKYARTNESSKNPDELNR